MHQESQTNQLHLELSRRIAATIPENGVKNVKPGLFFYRSSDSGERTHVVVDPSFCLVAQGSKNAYIGEECFRYDPQQFLITTVGLPITAEVVDASINKPYLGLRISLEPALVTSIMVESGFIDDEHDDVKAIEVSPVKHALLDAVLRLVRLTDSSEEYDFLAPLIIREIIFRLLLSEQRARLQYIANVGGRAHQIAKAIQKITDDFDKSLRVEEIAQQVSMSVSGFHAHFKSVTSMSPLQFQKQLRLQEARRLMLSENMDAAEAGFRVGYEDPSYFSREYKSYFGEPPKRDIKKLRSNNSHPAV